MQSHQRDGFARGFKLMICGLAVAASVMSGCDAQRCIESVNPITGELEQECFNLITDYVDQTPFIESITPDEGQQGTDVPISITGTRLAGGELCVNSVRGGTPGTIQVIAGNVLRIAADAPRGAYEIGVVRSGDVAPYHYVHFFVNGSDGTKTPRVSNVSPGFANEGTTVLMVFTGSNFDETATVSDLGRGLHFETPVYDPERGQLAVSVYIEPGAGSGIHRLYVTTAGGTSNPWNFELRRVAAAGPFVQLIAPNFIHAGETKALELFGTNFDVGAIVTVSDLSLPPLSVLSVGYQYDQTMGLNLQAPATHPGGTRTLTMTSVAGLSSGEVYVLDAAAFGPSLRGTTPTVVTRDARAFIKFTGANLGVNGPLTVRVQPSRAAFVQTIHRPSDPAKQSSEFTASFIVLPSLAHGETFHIAAVRHDGLISEAVPITLFQTPEGTPHASSVSKSLVRGASNVENTIGGYNLQDATEIRSSVRGLTFSDITPSADGTRVTFRMSVPASTPLPGDQAANLTVVTPNGVSNPVPFTTF